MTKRKWDFRDVSQGLRIFRDFLLGRKHSVENLHVRFPPRLAPRSIPPPDIPRGPEYKYSKQYYYDRNPTGLVKPPVIAPIAQGPPIGHDPTKKYISGGMKPDEICFNGAPRPGFPWWWDGHCYYECVPDPPPKQCPPPKPCPPPECPRPADNEVKCK